jgi:hypothetical protein
MALSYLEWGLNWCVYNHAHHYLLIHSAVIEKNGRSLVILGPSGSGKSTLCAALVLSGWRLLSDELAILSPADGRLSAVARPMSLKNESIRVIREHFPSAPFGPILIGSRKGTVAHLRPPRESVLRVGEATVPGWFVFVNYRAGACFELRPVARGLALLQIARSAFNYGLWGRVGFEALAQAVESAECSDLEYGSVLEAIDHFNEWAAGSGVAQRTAVGEPTHAS